MIKLTFSALSFPLPALSAAEGSASRLERSQKLGFKLPALLLFLFSTFQLSAQVQLDRQVIGSTGNESTGSSIKVVSTVGEVAVNTQTNSSLTITEGFQQPLQVQGLISFTLDFQNASCIGRSNGFAEILDIQGCEAPYNVFWSNGQSGNRVNNLAPGDYTVQIVSNTGCESRLATFEIETISQSACLLKFYSGITPNEDGINDEWIIDNIEAFPNNEVIIYDRNGNKVYEATNYENSQVVWKGDNLSGGPLPSDTYFYIFTAEGVTEKGWIELTR